MLSLESTEIAAVLLAFFAATLVGGAIQLFYERSRASLRRRLGNERGRLGTILTETEEARSPILSVLAAFGGIMGKGGASSKLRLKLTQAGLSSPASAQVFMGTKVALLCFSLVGALVVVLSAGMETRYNVLLVFMMTGLPFFVPNLVIEAMRSSRKKEVQRHLPDMVDLLEICVTGGLGLDAAWNAVAEQTRTSCPLLADEMAVTGLELQLGEDRGAAIRHMAERTGSADLSSLVAVLIQSERFGTSLSDALTACAQSLREARSMRAEENAEKMAVKMLFPMVVFIFPVEIMVAVGPAVITIIDVLL